MSDNILNKIDNIVSPYTKHSFIKGFKMSQELKELEMIEFLMFCVNKYSWIPYKKLWKEYTGHPDNINVYYTTSDLMSKFKETKN